MAKPLTEIQDNGVPNIKHLKYVVYAHYADSGQVFYIGIGNEKRPYQFEKGRRSGFWYRYVSKHCVLGKPEVKIWAKNLGWFSACKMEKEWIALYGRRDSKGGCLVNLTDGGEGAVGIKRPERTLEHRMKLGIVHKGKKPPPLSIEAKERIAAAQRGRTHSDETKRKIGEASKGRIAWNKGISIRKVGTKGYTFCKTKQKWMARIKIKGRDKYLGYFKTKEEASEVYQKALLEFSIDSDNIIERASR
jgi:hypothetical protein